MNPFKRMEYPALEQAYRELPAKDRRESDVGRQMRRAAKRKIRKAKASLPLNDWVATVRENQARGRAKQAQHAGVKA